MLGSLLALGDSTANSFDQFCFAAALFQFVDRFPGERVAEYHADATGFQEQASLSEGPLRAGNSHRINRQFGSPHEGRKSGFERPQRAVDAARPLWKNSDQKPQIKTTQRFADPGSPSGFATEWHDVRMPQDPADHGNPEERIPGEKTDRPLQREADQQGIKITLMVRQQQAATDCRNAFDAAGPIPQPNGEDDSQNDLKEQPDTVPPPRWA